MRDCRNLFTVEKAEEFKTEKQLRNGSEIIKPYKDYSIAFGTYQKNGRGTWWSISVWHNEGKNRRLIFRSKELGAIDAEAMHLEYQWARQNIDDIISR